MLAFKKKNVSEQNSLEANVEEHVNNRYSRYNIYMLSALAIGRSLQKANPSVSCSIFPAAGPI